MFKELTVMCDYGIDIPLWPDVGPALTYEQFKTLPLSATLKKRLLDWERLYEGTMDPFLEGDDLKNVEEALDDVGIELVLAIKMALPDTKIYWFQERTNKTKEIVEGSTK